MLNVNEINIVEAMTGTFLNINNASWRASSNDWQCYNDYALTMVRTLKSRPQCKDALEFVLNNIDNISICSFPTSEEMTWSFILSSSKYCVDLESGIITSMPIKKTKEEDNQLFYNAQIASSLIDPVLCGSTLIADTYFWRDYELLREILLLDILYCVFSINHYQDTTVSVSKELDAVQSTMPATNIDIKVNYDNFMKHRKPLAKRGQRHTYEGLPGLYNASTNLTSHFVYDPAWGKIYSTLLAGQTLIGSDIIRTQKLHAILSDKDVSKTTKRIVSAAVEAAQIIMSPRTHYVTSNIFKNLQYAI